jgi:hypothetical protein
VKPPVDVVVRLSGDVAAVELTVEFSAEKLYTHLFTPKLLYSPIRLVNRKSRNLNL